MTKSLTGVGIRGFMFKFKCKFKDTLLRDRCGSGYTFTYTL